MHFNSVVRLITLRFLDGSLVDPSLRRDLKYHEMCLSSHSDIHSAFKAFNLCKERSRQREKKRKEIDKLTFLAPSVSSML